MPYIKFKDKEEALEREIKRIFKSNKYEDKYIRKLIGKQNVGLCVPSKYYAGNIAEGNWSVLKDDSDIEKLDSEEIEEIFVDTCIKTLGKSIREKDAEYTYVFLPSYYAVKKLILYYLRYTIDAKKIYGLRNAVVIRDSKDSHIFYGGLPFVLKYLKVFIKDSIIISDFMGVIEVLVERKNGFDNNNHKDDFINDIIDCIKESGVLL